jgi:hypothetical protein
MEGLPQKKMEMATPEGGMTYIYSNHIRVGYSVADLRILFGELTDVTPEKYTITERTQVTMTWLQAKILLDILSNHIAAYEKHNGPIKTSFVSPFIVPLASTLTVTSPGE